jgi:hypothetical protein
MDLRAKTADIFLGALPKAPGNGPPLPSFLDIKWPNNIEYKFPKVVHVLSYKMNTTEMRIANAIRSW